MTRLPWTRTATPDTKEIINMTAPLILPAALSELDVVLPVGALARLVTPGAPRWAFTVLASDLVGPWRRVPRVGQQALEHGVPARAAGPRQLHAGSQLVNTPAGLVDVPLYRDGEWLDAAPAVPPLRGLLERAGSEGTLVELVTALDRLARIEIIPMTPDCPPELFVPSWAPMRSVISGAVPPPLRWSAPAGGGRRPELAALRRDARPERLIGVPRCAPPVARDGGLLESDGRLLAVRALVAHAASAGTVVDREDVVRLVGWVCGAERGIAPVAGRGTFAGEWQVPGVREADRVLAVADVDQVADQLLIVAESSVPV